MFLARVVESIEHKRQMLARVLPVALPVFLGVVVWVLCHFYILDLYTWVGFLFICSTLFGIYWSILLLERLIIYGFTRHKR